MGRLIEVQDARTCPSPLVVQSGDVLLFHANGGHVRSGADVVDLLPPLLSAVVGTDGTVMTPAGAPNTVLVRARRPGQATLDVVTGDPWHAPRATQLVITVES
jgi:hypothetical protein